jgi:hypothetical protein
MRRGLWFAAGAGAAIYAMVRGRRAAEVFTVDGLQDRLNGLAAGVRMFRDEVAEGKAEAETGLRERFALKPHGRPELTASGSTRQEEEGRADGTVDEHS